MHGFHATEGQCQYGLAIHGVSMALAAVFITMVVLLT